MEGDGIPIAINHQLFLLAGAGVAIHANDLRHNVGGRHNQAKLIVLGHTVVALDHIRCIVGSNLRTDLLQLGATRHETGHISHFQRIAFFRSEVFNMLADKVVVIGVEILCLQNPQGRVFGNGDGAGGSIAIRSGCASGCASRRTCGQQANA